MISYKWHNKRLWRYQVTQSMSRRGKCWDNAPNVAEDKYWIEYKTVAKKT